MNYKLIMLLKSENINDPNRYAVITLDMSWQTADLYLDSLALQGHDLKNLALYNPESKSLRFYESIDEYGYVRAEELLMKREYPDTLSQCVQYWKEKFDIKDSKTGYKD